MKYRIADFDFCDLEEWKELSNSSTDMLSFDSIFDISEEDIAYEDKGSKENYEQKYLAFIAFHRKIAEWLPQHGAFVLHSACFDINGVGMAFAAHSGTGKTTHMLNWQKMCGEKLKIVNGDKPIIRFFDNEPEIPYAYGTPWRGKESLGCNMRTKLQHICFIERSQLNYVEQMKKSDAIELIFNQVYRSKDPVTVMQTMQLIDRLLSYCKLWTIHCNMDVDSAKVAYKTIFGEKPLF